MKAQSCCLDRISALPQPIIEHILCRLSIEDVVRTSILSRHWRYNWIKIPELAFTEWQFKASALLETFSGPYERRCMTRRCKFLYAMYQVLLLNQGPIDVFSLSMDSIDGYYETISMYARETCAELDQIILHLSRNNTLKKFTLCFRKSDPCTLGYTLPFSLFSLNQLTHLSLGGCHLDDQPTFKRFGSLTTLYLDNVRISGNTLLHFVSSCPLIKRFTLLIDNIDYMLDVDDADITKLLGCLHVIEHLCISHDAIKCFAEDDGVPQELPTTLVHLKFFCFVDICFTEEYELPFVGLVIRSSPNLEKLRLMISQYPYPYDSPDESEIKSINLQDYSDIWLEHLKELEMEDFLNLKHELEFVKLILAKSPVLKKVSIFLNYKVTKDEEMMVLRILFCSPRASPHVKIFVKHRPEVVFKHIYPADECH